MKKRFEIVQTYWFIGAVALLLINDLLLKDVFHNWFTGKLSDFAGVFFLPLFFAVIFPKRIKELIIASAVFFIYWKSPLSEGLINLINGFNGFNYVRVVDYTDLMALAILPLAYYVYVNKDKWQKVRISPAIPFTIAGFAMMATSQEQHFEELDSGYNFNESQSDLFQRIVSNTPTFSSNNVNISFNDPTLMDTMYFNITISQGNMSKEAYVSAGLYKIDSVNTELYLLNFNQSGGDCSFFRPRCREPYDDKAVVLDELETRFVDQL